MHKLSIIVPFRDRYEHLKEFIPYMKKYLSDRGIQFTIFIINQNNNNLFNKGSLFNIGVHIISDEYDYIVLHDIDQLPILSDYTYDNNQVHISPYLEHLNYRTYSCTCIDIEKNMCKCGALENDTFYGGVIKTTKEIFTKINGFSNKYEGWGGEDDDFAIRSKIFLKKLYRIDGLYKSLPHDGSHRAAGNPNHQNNINYLGLVRGGSVDVTTDGLNQLNITFPYTIDSIEKIEEHVFMYNVNFPTFFNKKD